MTADRSLGRAAPRQRSLTRSSEGAWVAIERARAAMASGAAFARPVEVALDHALVRAIRTPREALDCLLGGQWPDKSALAYELAISDCLKAIAGADLEAARASFQAAARRAHILIADDEAAQPAAGAADGSASVAA